MENNTITVTVQNTVNAPVDKVWMFWNAPEHITGWAAASDDWHTTRAENDLRAGGRFLSRMEAKDGSFGFDFGGVYDDVKTHAQIACTLDDGRKLVTTFSPAGNTTGLSQTFDAEDTNPIELQRGGWQAILDNFKKYVEAR